MKSFDGFPPGKPRTTALPNLLFTDLLPLIDDLTELKVTLYAFYAIQQREGKYRYVRAADFASHEALMTALQEAAPATPVRDTLGAALERACARGTLLCAEVPLNGTQERIYFINAEPGRTAVRQIHAGKWQHGTRGHSVEIMPERPNVYRLYEENIGALTGIIADHLKDAERDYPEGWLEAAIRLAVEHEKRNWKYIQAVLNRWRKEGKHEIVRKPAAGDGTRSLLGDPDEFIIEL
jgi:DnaD/phage-associated family protein